MSPGYRIAGRYAEDKHRLLSNQFRGDDYLCSMKDRCWGDLEKRIVAPF